MNRPYNQRPETVDFFENGRKLWPLLILIALPIAGISCRKAAIATQEPGSVRPAAAAIAAADRFYNGRDDLVKVRQGIVALRQVQGEDQENYDLAWRLAKFNYYLGAHSPDSSEQEKAFHDGIEAGKLAVKLQDGKADGHFWLGANYGGSAKISILAGLSAFDDIKREMETVLKLDEGYQSGSAYMVLGRLYLEAPGLIGGDTQKAIEYLEKGLRFGPDNALLHAHLAEAYLEAHRNEDARKQIDAVLAMKPAPGLEPEHKEALDEVKKLQERLK
jgi:tetratricopeptide (TPR) repeat protein